MVDSLARAGVAVRPGAALGGPGHLRVTYGTRAENERFLGGARATRPLRPQPVVPRTATGA